MYIKSSATTRLVSHIQTPEFNLWEHWECVFLRQTDRQIGKEREKDQPIEALQNTQQKLMQQSRQHMKRRAKQLQEQQN